MENTSSPTIPERIDRRRFLRLSAAGATGLLAAPAAGQQAARVFVHPDDGGPPAAAAAVRDKGGAVRYRYDNFEFIAARVPANNLDDLRNDRRVARVNRDGTVRLIPPIQAQPPGGGPPGGGGGSCSSHPAQEPSWGWERIDAAEAPNDGSGVDVAILDTGIDADHCDLQANVKGGKSCINRGPSWDEDKNGHGTHCAGIAGAVDNNLGVVGVASSANLYGVQVLGPSGSGSWASVVCGIDWCITNNREIISMSLGGGYNESVAQALSNAYAAGHLLVAAAGNDGNNEDNSCSEDNVSFPATHEDVIAVSAMDSNDTIAGYSSVGDEIELMAPGTAIFSTYKDNTYETLSGTSMACPHVSGVAAIAWNTAKSNEEVRSKLRSTADDLYGCIDGSGLVDATLTS